ncbi:aspartyl protease family protein At5g10770 [Lolium perenne]|uniref:aspartyl protease family protein At5g10770 n=1 Tax=Lolium perenne TaxID=4522 RepID=UPI0021F515F9|nr:aspartyl protease family protein At5g10770-like [Lolium perenne]
MAAAVSSSRRRGHACFVRLVAAAAVVAAFVVGAARAEVGSSGGDRVLLNVESLFPGPSCAAPQEHKPNAATSARMRIAHRHGPCSPLADAHGKPPSHAEILAADQNRVESIQHRASATTTDKLTKRTATVQPSLKKNPAGHSTSSSAPSLPASSGRALGTGNYVVTIGLGTPASPYTVVFDTGSDTTWVQCRPCVVKCYKQKQPLFDPAKSSTYANISCADPACADLDQSGCSGGHCLYGLQYGDGSSTVGFYAQDTLTIAHDAIKGFRFGCGEKNSGLFGKAAGLMGLGRGSTSLTVQASGKYGGAFAYCLPASSSGTTGHLDFGPGAAPANAKLTPMLTDKGNTFYFVGLTGIRVGGEQLSIPETVFSTGGTIVDSGTVITRLPATANAALSSAFDKAMAAKGYKKAPAFSILDTCYDFTGVSEAALPAVSLVFQGGATLDVDASGIMFAVTPAQVCLAFASNGDDTSVGIIGNTQQKTHAVLFDLGKKTVGFAPGAC